VAPGAGPARRRRRAAPGGEHADPGDLRPPGAAGARRRRHQPADGPRRHRRQRGRRRVRGDRLGARRAARLAALHLQQRAPGAAPPVRLPAAGRPGAGVVRPGPRGGREPVHHHRPLPHARTGGWSWRYRERGEMARGR
jgi:hypothetical protein